MATAAPTLRIINETFSSLRPDSGRVQLYTPNQGTYFLPMMLRAVATNPAGVVVLDVDVKFHTTDATYDYSSTGSSVAGATNKTLHLDWAAAPTATHTWNTTETPGSFFSLFKDDTNSSGTSANGLSIASFELEVSSSGGNPGATVLVQFIGYEV